MSHDLLLSGLAGVVAAAAPVLFAAIGEALAERAGVINLSLNGTVLLSAMGSFAVAVWSDSLLAGFAAGMLIGAFVAWVVAFSSISLRLSQVAIGFVLALVCRDLAYFLGSPLMGVPGPRISLLAVPVLRDIPVLGPVLFRQDLVTYASYALAFAAWGWMYRSRAGLVLRGIGENPTAAYVRGVNVNGLRFAYTLLGGALVGLAGPAYSLSLKAGWKGTISGLDGIGWIALAITIFGGWHPLKIAFGAFLFALLQWLGIVLQPNLPGVPSQVLQVAPFPLMILTLLLVNVGDAEWVERVAALVPVGPRRALARVFGFLRASPPAALGVPFEAS